MIIYNLKELTAFRHKQGIYLFTNKKDPTKHYAGKANDLYTRIGVQHKNATDIDHQYIDRVIKKYGLFKYFRIEIIHWWDIPVNNIEALALETAVIDAYNCLKSKGGYNILLFGSDRTGIPHSQSTKEKLRIINLNKTISIATRKKMNQNRPIRRGDKHSLYDHTIYKFKHRITNEIFEGTRYNFYTKYKLNRSSINELIWKTKQSNKNWILLT